MTYTLVICYGVFLGICGQIQTIDFPSYEACNTERAAVLAQPTKPYYALCRPKLPPVKRTSE